MIVPDNVIKRIDIAEFRKFGYLQEVNRLFFHPLGLALEVVIDQDGERLGGIWDYREDPAGIAYGGIDAEKISRVAAEREKRAAARGVLFSGGVQGTPASFKIWVDGIELGLPGGLKNEGRE